MECSTIPAKVIASCFALASFAAAMLVGLVARNNASTIILRAIIIMLICWLIAFLIGIVAQRTVQDHIDAYKHKNPIESDPVQDPSDSQAGEVV